MAAAIFFLFVFKESDTEELVEKLVWCEQKPQGFFFIT